MIRLSNFSAIRYRGIDGVSLPQLSKANLITGANGVGKTALIEAMWLFTGRHNPGLLWNANIQRSSGSALDPVSRLTDGELEIHGVENGKNHSVKFVFSKVDGTLPSPGIDDTLKKSAKNLPPVVGLIHTYLDGKLVSKDTNGIQLTPMGSVLLQSLEAPAGRPGCVIETQKFQHETPTEYLQRYSSLVREGYKRELVKALDMVTKGADDIEILADNSGESYLSVVIKGQKPLPLHDLGGGAVRLVRLLLGFSAARDGLLLSDELENGIHHTVHRELWSRVQQWMEQWNVQFVATTHSGELIDAAIEAFADKPEDLSIHKFFRNGNKGPAQVATFTGDALVGARDLNLEVR